MQEKEKKTVNYENRRHR